MNFKKFSTSDNQWHDVPCYIRKTATDNITSLPTIIYGDGTNASLTIKGNTMQNGTPTPSAPVDVVGCGERTGNLFDKDNYNIVYGYFIAEGTTTITAESSNNIVYIPCKPNTTYTVSKILSKRFGIGYTIDKPATGVTVYGAVTDFTATSLTVTTDSSAKYLVSYIRNGNIAGESSLSNIVNSLQITESSTALPYEPYGYKIPITNNSQTTNVYLGETQSTRQIKKFILDGTEGWTKSRNDDTAFFKLQLSDYKLQTVAFCSHFEYANVTQSGTTLGFYIVLGSGMIRIRPENVATTSLESFLSFLSTQYSNGTPVTIYYVLDTPETIISNEPLYKIDNYSDSISASIPTTDGANTLDIPTTLQPSSVDVNYHGWHPMSDVHEYHVSTNLIDCEIEDGGYDAATGEKISGDYYRTADYIAVEPTTDYVFGRGDVSLAVYVCLYTSDKTFIERLYPKSGQYFTTSESTHYITIYRSNNISPEQWQLNKGQSILPYEAYYEPYWD